MNTETMAVELKRLGEEVRILRGEADIRRLMARYMWLCDIPLPEHGLDLEGRLQAIVELYAEDGKWEGVGSYYDNQFGGSVGHEQIYQHFKRFFQPTSPQLVLNCHYLTCEQIHVDGDTAEGQWVHFQPWIYDDGSSVLRSSRLNNRFRYVNGRWRIARYRTENVFIAPLPNDWATHFPATSVLTSPSLG
ncbi:MAG: hypothetical protein JWP42_4472 [Pseudomonas sp.]|nr:hypothetical protein [Pseudomonas sp.]